MEHRSRDKVNLHSSDCSETFDRRENVRDVLCTVEVLDDKQGENSEFLEHDEELCDVVAELVRQVSLWVHFFNDPGKHRVRQLAENRPVSKNFMKSLPWEFPAENTFDPVPCLDLSTFFFDAEKSEKVQANRAACNFDLKQLIPREGWMPLEFFCQVSVCHFFVALPFFSSASHGQFFRWEGRHRFVSSESEVTRCLVEDEVRFPVSHDNSIPEDDLPFPLWVLDRLVQRHRHAVRVDVPDWHVIRIV